MESIITNYRVSNKLNDYFEDKIKIIFSSKVDVIIVKKDYQVYKFDSEICERISTSNDNSEIEAALFEGLCGKKIVDFASSNSHAVALNEDGSLLSWSWINSKYDLGLERLAMVDNTPKLVENLKNEFIQSVCCGSDHILCLTTEGKVYAWGSNEWGQIGCGKDDREIELPAELQYFNGMKVIEISSGAYHCIALTSDGKAHSWGRNNHGQLGISSSEDVNNKPQPINMPRIEEIFKKTSCGAKHSLLLSENGSIYAFGSNEYYQLAREGKADSNVPIKIESPFTFTEISAHFEKELSVAKSEVQNQLFVWGKSGNEEFAVPTEVDLDWLNKIFFSHHKLFYKIIEQNFNLKTKFTSNGSFKELFESEYINRGSFGFVYKCIRKSDIETFAIKVIPFQKNLKDYFTKELETSKVIRKIENDRLIKYYNLWFENNFESPDGDKYDLAFYIQMNYCLKAMKDMIFQIKTNFKNGDSLNLLGYFIASELFVETSEGVKVLHNLDPAIIHRDLNPNNILVTYDRNGRFVKIADFGLIALHEFENTIHSLDRGHTDYLAPEVIDNAEYNTKADVYSLGKIMKELFLNNFYKVYSEEEKRVNILSLKYCNLNKKYKQMLDLSFDDRPTCEEILNDKKLWALDAKELDLAQKKQFRQILTSQIREFPMYSNISLKLIENGSIQEVYVALVDRPIGGSLYYEMSKAIRGKCLIINNATNEVSRESKIFKSIFTQLHFKVEMKDKLKALEIKDLLSSLAEDEKLAKNEALVIMIISKGANEQIFGYNGCENVYEETPISLAQIVDIFSDKNCPFVRNIPKLFFFNCFNPECKQKLVDSQTTLSSLDKNWSNHNRDSFILYSCTFGNENFYDSKTGVSNFGQIFSEILAEYSCLESLNSMVYRTIKRIESKNIQIECSHKMRRELYFNPGYAK